MPMRTLVVVLLCLAAALPGCRKKSAPQFYQLESTWSIMVARDGDDAYQDPVMDQVVTGLEQIPPDAIEGPKASELLAKIAGERARLAAEKAAAEKLEAAAATERASLPSLFEPPAAAPAADPAAARAAVDAGPPRPFSGMTREAFQKAWGDCTEAAGELEVPGLGAMTGFAVQDRYACRQRLGVPEDARHVFLFKDGKLKVERTEKVQPPAPPKPAAPPPSEGTPDGGDRIMYVPGAPLPPGYVPLGTK